MINNISDIHDLGFEFSFKWGKDISIEVSYTETIQAITNYGSSGNGNHPFSFVSSQSTKPILSFKVNSDDQNFNFVKNNFNLILNEFIKIFLNWYFLHEKDMTEILSNFDDKRILRDVEVKICRDAKLKNLIN